ncbi:MAG: hypothetical protein WBC92_06150 [Terracidiphilus sp.]
MTLLDAPKFDVARDRRNTMILRISAAALLVLFVVWWLVAGRPVDWPWNWNHYWFGRITVNRFMVALEANDLPKAYGVWVHDKDWQQHPQQYSVYPFSRFQDDWGPTSPDNEYGPIHSHKVALVGRYGNGVLAAILINGRKSNALDLDYDPRTGQLSYAPPGVQLYLGP